MYEQIDFEFRYQADINSFYVPLLRYLQKKNGKHKKVKTTEFAREQMILWALSAFWYPLACKSLGGFTEVELKQKARNAIYQLQQQIVYLAQNFGLEPQEFSTPMTGATPNSSFNQVPVSKEPTVSGTSTAPVESSVSVMASLASSTESVTNAGLSDPLLPGAMGNEDDQLLDELFNK